MSLRAAKGMLSWCQRLGVSPVPLAADSNMPFHKAWGLADFTAQDFLDKQGRLLNVGWLLGPRSGWLCDIDIDTDDGEEIYKISGVYEDIGALAIGYSGRVSHYMFRVSGRPEFHEPVGYSIVFGHKRDNGKEAGLEWLLGGKKLDGTPKQKQSRVWGRHQSGARLEFLGGRPETADDIPTIDWQEANEMWDDIQTKLGGTKRRNSNGKGSEQNYAPAVREARDLDLELSMKAAIRLMYGITVQTDISSQMCPVCKQKALLVHEQSAYCYHENSCPSKEWCEGGGFHVGHLVSHRLKLDWDLEDEQSLAASIWWARELAVDASMLRTAAEMSVEQRAQPWSELCDIESMATELEEILSDV